MRDKVALLILLLVGLAPNARAAGYACRIVAPSFYDLDAGKPLRYNFGSFDRGTTDFDTALSRVLSANRENQDQRGAGITVFAQSEALPWPVAFHSPYLGAHSDGFIDRQKLSSAAASVYLGTLGSGSGSTYQPAPDSLLIFAKANAPDKSWAILLIMHDFAPGGYGKGLEMSQGFGFGGGGGNIWVPGHYKADLAICRGSEARPEAYIDAMLAIKNGLMSKDITVDAPYALQALAADAYRSSVLNLVAPVFRDRRIRAEFVTAAVVASVGAVALRLASRVAASASPQTLALSLVPPQYLRDFDEMVNGRKYVLPTNPRYSEAALRAFFQLDQNAQDARLRADPALRTYLIEIRDAMATQDFLRAYAVGRAA